MHNRLYGCQYMAHYVGVFRAHVLDIVDFIQTPPKDPALFLVRRLYYGGNLGQYMYDKRRNEEYLEPMHLLQMCISLFSMVKEAHLLNIGLVDITPEGLQVDAIGMLYFNSYQSCLDLQDTIVNRNKPWMVNTKFLKCPEAKSMNNMYKKSADVFAATLIMLDLAQHFDYNLKKLHTIDHKTKTVIINKDALDPRHSVMFCIIQQGLNYNPEQRPTASAILYALETSRKDSLMAGR
ncbi:hypothetical protein HPULCUR_008565 [Helicostylum pulchrum]|uniref:Protein kinase domain-containing protein n=1 Tax=Helicostylum pulchrum TaxID=562976 RepID=A0ABP9Y904_9FUNG